MPIRLESKQGTPTQLIAIFTRNMGTPRKSSGASDKSQTSISDHVEHLKAERRNAIIRQNIIYKTKSATFENEQIEARVKRDKLAVRDLDRITEARKAKLKAQEMIERQLKAIKEELQGFDTAEAELHDLMRKNQIDSHKEVMDYIRELAAQRTIKIEKVQERCLADLEEIAILGDGNVLEISSLLPLTEEDLSLTFKDKRCTNSRDTKDNEEENDKTVSDVPGLSRSPAQVAHNSGGEHEGTSMEIDDYDNPTTPVSTDPMATNISQRFRGITEGSSPPMQRKLASPFEARDNVKQAGRDSVKDTKKRKIEALLTNPSKRARSTQASPNAPVAIMKQFSKKTSNNMESGQWSDSNYGDAFPLTHLRCGNQTWTLRENLSYRQHVSSYRIEVFKDKTLCLSSFHANLIFTPSSVSEVAFGGGKTVEHDDMTIIVTKNDAQATKIHMVFQKRSDVERMAWAIVKINPMAGMDVKDGTRLTQYLMQMSKSTNDHDYTPSGAFEVFSLFHRYYVKFIESGEVKRPYPLTDYAAGEKMREMWSSTDQKDRKWHQDVATAAKRLAYRERSMT